MHLGSLFLLVIVIHMGNLIDCINSPNQKGLRMKGAHKWLGGAVDSSGLIYGVPACSNRILRIDPKTDSIELLEEEINGKFKWLRGIYIDDEDSIICIPAWSDHVLRIYPKDGSTKEFGYVKLNQKKGWNWHGGQLSPIDHCLYAIPSNAEQALKIDTKSNIATLIGPKIEGRNKYYGGLLSSKGCIYGIPYRGENVIKINPDNQNLPVELLHHKDITQGFDQTWHGGLTSTSNGKIYGIPSNANNVLVINPDVDTIDMIPVPGERGKYLWGGAVETKDGIIYCIPSDSTDILKINTNNHQIDRFGGPGCKVYSKSDAGELHESKHSSLHEYNHNKWQGGVLASNGLIICIPCHASHILVIDTNTDKLIEIGQEVIKNGLDKWQGGYLTHGSTGNEIVFGIPENADYVLKVDCHTLEVKLLGENCSDRNEDFILTAAYQKVEKEKKGKKE